MDGETNNPTGSGPSGQDPNSPSTPAPDFEGAPPDEGEGNAVDAATDSEMAEFLAHLNQTMPRETASPQGAPFDVTVVALRAEGVVIDVGGKEEAVIPVDEFVRVGEGITVKPGDVIPVIKMGRGEHGVGHYSHREARARLATESIREAHANHTPVKGRVGSVVKGGLIVDCGLSAFMPASQIDLFKIPDLKTMVGQEIEAHVIEYDHKRRRAVLSRRQLLVERREADRQKMMAGLEVGSRVTGKVKSALDFGVFLDLGGIDGFIPREEVSFDRGTSPATLVKVGDQLEVIVTRVDAEKGKIALSRRRALPDPWVHASGKYHVGDIIQGTVVSIQKYGAFVHLEEGVTGMIHATDMSWSLGSKKTEDFVRAGDTITAQILEIDADKRRLSLGLKQLADDPWAAVKERFPVGSTVKGAVTSLTNYGAFVKVDEQVEGMIHVSDMVWDRRLNHPKEVLTVGQEVEAQVLKTDGETRRLSLGLKQLQESPYDAYQHAHPQGSVVTGKVTRFAPFGAFVEIAPGLEGLIHISQLDTKRVELPESVLKMGEEISVKVLKYDPKNRKISLSRKEALKSAEREEIKQYTSKANKGEAKSFNTLGEAFREARAKE